jgi:hypothetical protein
MMYKRQDYWLWLQQNPNGSYLEYLAWQIRIINLDLRFSALLSKEEKDYLEREKGYFLAKMHKVKWAIKTREVMQWT